MEFEVGTTYKTRDDILITVLKNTPQCKYKMVAYFQIRQTRIRVFYDEKGDEFFGERGLDIMNKQLNPGPFVIKPLSYKP